MVKTDRPQKTIKYGAEGMRLYVG